MLADWNKLDREVACINNRLDLCRRVEALREVSVSLFLCLFWCLFPTLVFSVCACRHANRRQRRGEDMRDKQRQCEAGSGSGLLALLRFVLLGRAQLESQTTPPFSPHQQKCIHLDTHRHMRSSNWVFYWALPCSALLLSVDSAFIQQGNWSFQLFSEFLWSQWRSVTTPTFLMVVLHRKSWISSFL